MIRLFYNYYKDLNTARAAEINFCLQKNTENKNFETIVFETSDKPTYKSFFDKINTITGDNDINIISNSDIYFDDTILLANKIESHQAYALSRWDVKSVVPHIVMLFDYADSQDTWIFRGKVRNVFGDFTLGKRGCDNRIAHELIIAKYSVLNPSKTIKTYHLHLSNIRNYNGVDVVPPPYVTIKPDELK